eukprot:363369-Chlamydomonas_euryale.AAC.11
MLSEGRSRREAASHRAAAAALCSSPGWLLTIGIAAANRSRPTANSMLAMGQCLSNTPSRLQLSILITATYFAAGLRWWLFRLVRRLLVMWQMLRCCATSSARWCGPELIPQRSRAHSEQPEQAHIAGSVPISDGLIFVLRVWALQFQRGRTERNRLCPIPTAARRTQTAATLKIEEVVGSSGQRGVMQAVGAGYQSSPAGKMSLHYEVGSTVQDAAIGI